MTSDQLFSHYKNLIQQEPQKYIEDYKEIKKTVDNSSAIYDGEPVQFLYQPVFYTEKEVSFLKKVTARLSAILKQVIEHYLNDAEFRSYFPFPRLMEELILVDPGYEQSFPMARFDIFYGPETLKFCELNTDGTSGMNEARVIQNCFQKSQIINDLSDEYSFRTYELFYSWIEALTENYRAYGGCPEDNPGLAIVDFAGEGVESEFEEFQKRFQKQGYRVWICDPRELEYRKKALYYKNQQVDVIYRRATTSRLLEEAGDIEDLLKAYRQGDVCMVGGFVSQIIHNKVIFSILHDENKVDFLDSEDREFIAEHIPYTALFDYGDRAQRREVLNNKDHYIIKPCDWFACHGVHVGADYTADEWADIIEGIKDEDYIVQEFCPPPRREMLTINPEGDWFFEEYNILTGIYLYNNTFQGIYNRAGRENIIGSVVESFTLPAFIKDQKEG